ncbi:uncharacterized protein LTR77_001570 [Saxophila tyrrhenica]|uniref:Uncharacterized protein n=1 Tax=Saxophila tyrrhenica TaxID=1690608 RepID=A0AAV9PKN8_9PEZI|nr:hypothetical protein LTR77_001570 [Saxophila tyrrhenica]
MRDGDRVVDEGGKHGDGDEEGSDEQEDAADEGGKHGDGDEEGSDEQEDAADDENATGAATRKKAESLSGAVTSVTDVTIGLSWLQPIASACRPKSARLTTAWYLGLLSPSPSTFAFPTTTLSF